MESEGNAAGDTVPLLEVEETYGLTEGRKIYEISERMAAAGSGRYDR